MYTLCLVHEKRINNIFLCLTPSQCHCLNGVCDDLRHNVEFVLIVVVDLAAATSTSTYGQVCVHKQDNIIHCGSCSYLAKNI